MDLRRARPEDSRLVWSWANDPQTRANSFDPTPIAWEDHCAWFARQDDLWVGWDGEVPVGSVRLHDGEISVTVAPEQRGKGYAAQLIRAAVRPNTRAQVFEENVPSYRAFVSARFVELERKDGVIEMVWPGLH